MSLISSKEKLKILGKRMQTIRKQNGFSQEKLANKCNIEISQISRIERGVINTSIGNILLISEKLNIDIKELFE